MGQETPAGSCFQRGDSAPREGLQSQVSLFPTVNVLTVVSETVSLSVDKHVHMYFLHFLTRWEYTVHCSVPLFFLPATRYLDFVPWPIELLCSFLQLFVIPLPEWTVNSHNQVLYDGHSLPLTVRLGPSPFFSTLHLLTSLPLCLSTPSTGVDH